MHAKSESLLNFLISILFSFDDLLVDSSDDEVEETKFKKKVNKCNTNMHLWCWTLATSVIGKQKWLLTRK